MENSPDPWIAALRNTHDTLTSIVEPLEVSELRRPSAASEWTIADVLSHLGSQAEVFGLFLDAGLSGEEPPGREAFVPIWDVWNAKRPEEQAIDALRADGAVTSRFESLDAGERARVRLSMWGMELDITALARMGLGERALHTWDIAVALDPAATVIPEATGLLIDTLGDMVGRAGKPDGTKRQWHIATHDPERHFLLETGDAMTLTATDGQETPDLRLPAEAFLRLVYGRLGPGHTPALEATQSQLTELRQLFPGF